MKRKNALEQLVNRAFSVKDGMLIQSKEFNKVFPDHPDRIVHMLHTKEAGKKFNNKWNKEGRLYVFIVNHKMYSIYDETDTTQKELKTAKLRRAKKLFVPFANGFFPCNKAADLLFMYMKYCASMYAVNKDSIQKNDEYTTLKNE